MMFKLSTYQFTYFLVRILKHVVPWQKPKKFGNSLLIYQIARVFAYSGFFLSILGEALLKALYRDMEREEKSKELLEGKLQKIK